MIGYEEISKFGRQEIDLIKRRAALKNKVIGKDRLQSVLDLVEPCDARKPAESNFDVAMHLISVYASLHPEDEDFQQRTPLENDVIAEILHGLYRKYGEVKLTMVEEPERKIVQVLSPTYAKRADGSDIKFPIRRGRKAKRRERNHEGNWIPLLNKTEKAKVKHMTNHDRCIFNKIARLDLGITVAEYKLRHPSGS